MSRFQHNDQWGEKGKKKNKEADVCSLKINWKLFCTASMKAQLARKSNQDIGIAWVVMDFLLILCYPYRNSSRRFQN